MSWDEYKLSELFDVARGGSPRPIQDYLTEDESGLNWIMISDASDKSKYIEKTNKKIIPEGLKKTRQVYKGDFLLSNSMSFGKPYILKIDGCIHDGWLVLSPKNENIFPDFYFYLLGSEITYRKFESLASGAVVKNLNTTIVKNVKIPLPPLPEQKRIADILDKADALREQRKTAIAMLDELLQATFLDMFGDPVMNEKGWKFEKLEKVTDKITDGTHHSPPIVETGIPYVTAKHLKKDGLKFFDNPWYVSEQSHKEIYSRCNPVKGDVLYIKDGATTGIAAVNQYDFEFSMLSSLALIKINKEVLNNHFLCHLLNNERNKIKLTANMGGAAIKRFTIAKIKKFDVMLPPLHLQNQFAEIVEKVEAQKAVQQAHLAELDDLFGCLQQQAFNGVL